MKHIWLGLLVAGLFISIAPAKALAFDSFGFYCAPYTKPFEDGKHYIPRISTATTSGQCWFEVPATLAPDHTIQVLVYKGVPGNAQPVGVGATISPFYSYDVAYDTNNSDFNIYDTDGNAIPPKQDDDFFTVAFDFGFFDTNNSNPTLTQFQNFFTKGGTAPNDHYQIIKWKWGAKPQSEWDPIIIIPGILGSWQDPITGQWVLDPIKQTYNNLVDTLKTNGYAEDKTLFTFPYDWERSNVDTAKLLAQKIADIKATCSCDKVDIVAHSMGGLVATQYIESSDYKDDVDQLIMLGTPLAGSPKVYGAWEAGTINLGSPSIDAFLQGIFNREATDNNYSSVFDYIHQKPVSSVQELLPIFQNYLKLGSSFLQFPAGYPTNPFLQNLIGDPSTYYNKVLNKVQTYVVVGEKGATSTATGFQIKNSSQLPFWQDGEPIATLTGEGDTTVPLDSAIMLSGPDKELKGVEHMNLPTESESYVFSQLTGGVPNTLIKKPLNLLNPWYLAALSKLAPHSQDYAPFLKTLHDAFSNELIGHTLLFIALFSPIDVKVTAPDGKQVGIDFASHTAINQTTNAVYSGPIGEHEYVVIEDPLPGQYKVETIGTDNGEYTVAAGRIDEATTTTSLVSGTTTLNQIISNNLFVSSTSTAISLTPPPPPVATTTPTTTVMTLDTCVADIALAYKNKWITKKAVFNNLTFDCKALAPLFKTKAALEKIAKPKPAEKLLLAATIAAIKLDLADMDLLAKDKSNTKDAVSLITKITTWFRNHELH